MQQPHYPTSLKGGKLFIAALMLALANFMVVLDMTIANVSITHIAGGLAVSRSQGTWVITSYAVAEAICIPLTAWLSTRFGSIRVFMVSLLGFTLFSVLCGLSSSLGMLILCRIGQGLFGGPIMPLSQTLLLRIYPKTQQNKAVAIWASTTVVGPILGPILGGSISDNLSWHWIFFINLPIGLLCSLAIWFFFSKFDTKQIKLPVDYVGLLLLIIWVAALQLMIDLGHDYRWFDSLMICTLAVIAVIGSIAFILWEIYEPNPIVDLKTFRHFGFSCAVLSLIFGFAVFFGGIVILPQWLQTNLNYNATWAGCVTATTGIGSIIMSPIVAKWAYKFDQRKLASTGLILLAAITMMRAFWNNDVNFGTVSLPQILQGFCIPLFFIPLFNLAMASIPQQEHASAVGLISLFRTLSGAVGTSLAITLWDDYAIVARSDIVSKLNTEDTVHTLMQQGYSYDMVLKLVENLVEKEALTLSAAFVFMVFMALFIVAALLVWLAPSVDEKTLKDHSLY